MKGEIARLKMELGLIIQAQKESERNAAVRAWLGGWGGRDC